MTSRLTIPTDVHTAWHAAVRERSVALGGAQGHLSLSQSRFVDVYDRLRRLPRRLRRQIQRQWKHSLAGVALALTLGVGPAQAGTITVDGTTCTLIDAITAANTNTDPLMGCGGATAGVDTLVLQNSSVHTLTTVDNSAHGASGLPVITSEIVIEGNGSTIERMAGTPNFRVFTVGSSGDLILNDATVRNGQVSGSGFSGSGGGLLNNNGALTLIRCRVSGNRATFGGGLLNLFSQLTLRYSTVEGNTAARGGGLQEQGGTLILTNSTVSGNTAASSGGGLSLTNPGTRMLTNSTVSGNTAAYGGGIRSDGGSLTSNHTTIAGNSSTLGGGIFATDGTVTLSRTLISGNSASTGAEVDNYNNGTFFTANDFNLFGHSGVSNAQAFSAFTPGVNDLTATANGNTPTALGDILDPTLQNNGGDTDTHNLVANSPAIDAASGCPPPTEDQRGFVRPIDGDGSMTDECDIGSVEFDGPLPTMGCTINGVVNQLCAGSTGNDTIIGTAGNDVINGGGGDDVLKGGGGDDTLDGGEGNDTLIGGMGDDTLSGGTGDDTLRGEAGDDTLSGGAGKDTLLGGAGTDTLDGGAGNDKLLGHQGNDSLDGGDGTDYLDGGVDTDSCANGETLTRCE
jgi:Ca2+-binding RTX toxin-like protein